MSSNEEKNVVGIMMEPELKFGNYAFKRAKRSDEKPNILQFNTSLGTLTLDFLYYKCCINIQCPLIFI